MMNQPIDMLPMWGLLLIVIGGLFISAEFGFLLGKGRRKRIDDIGREEKQASSIMGAALGLLAFLLAFTFAMANTIHAERKSLVVEETNALGTLYLRSQLFDDPQMNESRQLIKDYVEQRVKGANWQSLAELDAAIKESEKLQQALWVLAMQMHTTHHTSMTYGLYIDALNEVIDIHTLRINAGTKRLPQIVRIVLFVIAMVTLAMLGYQSGLNGVRAMIPRAALILSLSVVMLLILDLDRPGSSLISISQQTMVDLQQSIAKDL